MSVVKELMNAKFLETKMTPRHYLRCWLTARAVALEGIDTIDAHRRLKQEERRAWDQASEEERETASASDASFARGPWSFTSSRNDRLSSEDFDSSLPQPKFSFAMLVKKVRDGDFIQLLLVLREPSTCLQVYQFEWTHPVLNMRVLGAIMVGTGLRAAVVSIHREMRTEHALDNVTGGMMLNTLLSH